MAESTFGDILTGLAGLTNSGIGLAQLFGGNPTQTVSRTAAPQSEIERQMLALASAQQRAATQELGYNITTNADGTISLNKRAPTYDEGMQTAIQRQLGSAISKQIGGGSQFGFGRQGFGSTNRTISNRNGLLEAIRGRLGQSPGATPTTGAPPTTSSLDQALMTLFRGGGGGQGFFR